MKAYILLTESSFRKSILQAQMLHSGERNREPRRRILKKASECHLHILNDLPLADPASPVPLPPSIHQLNSETAAKSDIFGYTVRKEIQITEKCPIRASKLTDVTYPILHHSPDISQTVSTISQSQAESTDTVSPQPQQQT